VGASRTQKCRTDTIDPAESLFNHLTSKELSRNISSPVELNSVDKLAAQGSSPTKLNKYEKALQLATGLALLMSYLSMSDYEFMIRYLERGYSNCTDKTVFRLDSNDKIREINSSSNSDSGSAATIPSALSNTSPTGILNNDCSYTEVPISGIYSTTAYTIPLSVENTMMDTFSKTTNNIYSVIRSFSTIQSDSLTVEFITSIINILSSLPGSKASINGSHSDITNINKSDLSATFPYQFSLEKCQRRCVNYFVRN